MSRFQAYTLSNQVHLRYRTSFDWPVWQQDIIVAFTSFILRFTSDKHFLPIHLLSPVIFSQTSVFIHKSVEEDFHLRWTCLLPPMCSAPSALYVLYLSN